MKRILASAVFVLQTWAGPSLAADPAGFHVLEYAADVSPNLVQRTVEGEVEIRLVSRVDRLPTVDLAAADLAIEAVRDGGRAAPYESRDGRLLVTLQPPAGPGETRTLTVRYSGQPTRGVRFGTDHVHTFFHTSNWLVSKDDPADKASLTLRLTLPSGLETVANGTLLQRTTLADGRALHVWRQDRPYSSYLFGFAAGRFQQHSRRQGNVLLSVASPNFSAGELERLSAATAPMLDFFAGRAGLPYPGEVYTQVFVPNGPAQEASGFSVMSEAYGRSVLDDPREDYLIAHELAHQWWGNLVTCKSWSHFWLNEGMATYMAAAFKEFWWGREEYDREMVMARLRYERALAGGQRRPLVFTGWARPEEMSGPITYSKGALALHLLRHQLGDQTFWEGVRDYTRAGAGGVVDTESLRTALERASGQSLSWLFSQWMYSEEPEELVARHRLESGAVAVEIEQRQRRPWQVPLTIRVKTGSRHLSRRVLLTRSRERFRFPIPGAVVSVRIDGDGSLPRFVQHERPLSMLLHQLRSEPDQPGRVDALIAIEKACSPPARETSCAAAEPVLWERAAADPSRLIRQLAARTAERIRPPDR